MCKDCKKDSISSFVYEVESHRTGQDRGRGRVLLKKAPSGRELPTESGEGEGEGRGKREEVRRGVSEIIFAFGE